MRKIDKAVEIVRGWSDEELKEYILESGWCPSKYNNLPDYIDACALRDIDKDCEDCWNEEVEE